MSIPHLEEGDLLALRVAFPKLDFEDGECRAVLLAPGSCDVQASPGSGKTTILAAKLYLLARRWTSERSGLCVISHTNTAAREIRHRIGQTSEGMKLLAYPHFIGTIHAFANQYLALPRLRNMGIQVDCIDDDVFSARAVRAANCNYKVRYWMEQSPELRVSMVATLCFNGPGLAVVAGNGAELPKEGGVVGDFLRQLKWNLAHEGVLRHDDMLSLAEDMLVAQKRLQALLAARFPLVMIDEMQDTSARQDALLRGAFGDGAILQRFGDRNQRIFDKGSGDVDFPQDGYLSMSTSRRFGPAIAEMVSRVRETGPAVVGKGPVSPHKPTIMVYETAVIPRVIPHFGELVLARFDDATLATGGRVCAVCARRTSNASQPPGRHVGDFWPPLAAIPADAPSRMNNAWDMLAVGAGTGGHPSEMAGRAERARRVVLLALRQAGVSAALEVREPWRLFRNLRDEGFDLRPIQLVCRALAMGEGYVTLEQRERIIEMLFNATSSLLPDGCSLETFAKLTVFELPVERSASFAAGGQCRVRVGEREVIVDVDTVAMTKGETHLATLYLESYGLSRRFDVPDVAHLLAGLPAPKGKLPSTVPVQRRHVYVGISRPTDFLCLAVNSARITLQDIAVLETAGWDVVRVA